MREKRLACFFVHQAIDKPNDPNDPRVEKQLLDYDARGNLTHIQREINNPELPMDTSRESVQKLVWDEEDRLLGVDLRPESDRGQPHIAAYTYDASGERGIRYVPRQQEGVSSGATSGYAQDMDIMLYPNALVTVRPQELTEEFNFREPPPEYTFTTYTKHYYIGSERINSKLGTVNNLGLLCEEMGPSTDLINEMNDRANGANKWLEKLYHYLGKELEIATPYLCSTSHSLVCGFKSHNPKLYDAYWYHPDHLGSSSFITNTTGEISQHFEYLPFGETLVEEHLNSYNSPFKFNGKEYDAETGNYYYGARYMNPKWSTFLTPDPALESYPSISPYAYTLNNPVRYVDPSGMYVEEAPDDIVIKGKNNSSLIITTSIALEFETNIDFGGNYTLFDISNIAIGYEMGANATGAAVVGTSYSGSVISTLFLGGDYSGYWYDYVGGEVQGVLNSSAEGTIGAHKNWFVAFNKKESANTPEGFAGNYFGGGGAVGGKLGVVGVNFNTSMSVSEDQSWQVLSLGASATIGPQIGLFLGGAAGVEGHMGTTRLLNTPVPTKERSMIDKTSNWLLHLKGAL